MTLAVPVSSSSTKKTRPCADVGRCLLITSPATETDAPGLMPLKRAMGLTADPSLGLIRATGWPRKENPKAR